MYLTQFGRYWLVVTPGEDAVENADRFRVYALNAHGRKQQAKAATPGILVNQNDKSRVRGEPSLQLRHHNASYRLL